MGHSERIVEVQQGLADYKSALIEMHEGIHGSIDCEEIRQRLHDEGTDTHSPIITIPYETEHLQRVVKLTERHEWQDPFVAERIKDALEIREQLDNGQSIYDTGFPTPFYSTLLDMAVAIDDTEVNAASFGQVYAKGQALDAYGHEFTHSAFAGLSSSSFEPVPETEVVEVREICGIGQTVIRASLQPFGGQVGEYLPVWN